MCMFSSMAPNKYLESPEAAKHTGDFRFLWIVVLTSNNLENLILYLNLIKWDKTKGLGNICVVLLSLGRDNSTLM
jgi:hypothetical protein